MDLNGFIISFSIMDTMNCAGPGSHIELKYIYIIFILTSELCNQMGTVFAEMSSRTALRRILGMKTTFQTKYMNTKMFVSLL